MRNISKDILSACLLDSENLAQAIERGVAPDWFETNGILFGALTKLSEVQKWDRRSSINVLDAAGVYDKHPVAMDLSADAPEWAFNLEELGQALEVLAGEHAKRTLRSATQDAQLRLVNGDDPFEVGGLLASQVEDLDAVADATKQRSTSDVAGDSLEMDTLIANGERIGLPFPWFSFQRRTFGIPMKSVTPLFGRDGKGKSRLATYLAHSWISQGIPILYMPFEDTAERFMSNLAATHGGYDMFTIKRHNVPDDFMPRHQRCLEEVSKMPIYIEDVPCPVERVVSYIARYKRKYGIEGVVIDGLKDVIKSKGENNTTQEDHINASMVRASKKYNVSILNVSHINKVDDDEWISKSKITGSGNQSKSARMVLAYQDAGIPSSITSKYQMYEDEIVLQAQKASYGSQGIVVLRPDLENGTFTEVYEKAEAFGED